jgi:CBS-domain-containing membrane protein
MMYHCKVKRLPVVTEDGRLAGIISRADLLSVYSRPDSEITQEITQSLAPGFTVTVKDGIVTLEGVPDSAEAGRDVVAGAWHVPGVVSVRDRLSYPPADHLPQSPGPLSRPAR